MLTSPGFFFKEANLFPLRSVHDTNDFDNVVLLLQLFLEKNRKHVEIPGCCFIIMRTQKKIVGRLLKQLSEQDQWMVDGMTRRDTNWLVVC